MLVISKKQILLQCNHIKESSSSGQRAQDFKSFATDHRYPLASLPFLSGKINNFIPPIGLTCMIPTSRIIVLVNHFFSLKPNKLFEKLVYLEA